MKTWKTSGGHVITRILSGRSNAFLITNSKEKILIDTGPGFMWKTLQKRLKKLKIDRLDLLILTHTHFDHSANAAKIREKYNARVLVHRTEGNYLLKGDNILPSGTNRFTKLLVKMFAGRFRSFALYEPCNPDILAEEIYDLSVFGLNGYVMHTPGHTTGSLSVIIDEEIALVGDTMFGVFRRSIYPPFSNDVPEMLKSWNKLLQTGCSLFIPSHGSMNNRELVQMDYSRKMKSLNKS